MAGVVHAILAELPAASWAHPLREAIAAHYPEDGALHPAPDEPRHRQRPADRPGSPDSMSDRARVDFPTNRSFRLNHQGQVFVGQVVRYNPRTMSMTGVWDGKKPGKIRMSYPLAWELLAPND